MVELNNDHLEPETVLDAHWGKHAREHQVSLLHQRDITGERRSGRCLISESLDEELSVLEDSSEH